MASSNRIEKDVPLPPKWVKYPLDQMEAGDSFLAAEEDRARISAAINRYSKRSGKRFTCRKVDGGLRVWRIA